MCLVSVTQTPLNCAVTFNKSSSDQQLTRRGAHSALVMNKEGKIDFLAIIKEAPIAADDTMVLTMSKIPTLDS